MTGRGSSFDQRGGGASQEAPPVAAALRGARSLSAPIVDCQGVWKIFCDHPESALSAMRRDGLDRSAIFQRFGGVVAVENVTFSVAKGEVFCVMGLSGSGKSTLLRHINRLVEPTAGKIIILGEDIGSRSPADLRRIRAETIGMVFQHVALFPHRTVRDNVAFGLEVRGVRRARRQEVAEEMLALVKLGGWGDRLPHELSGGMQQRVGLARALASDPEILLMDEPFSALDPLIRRELQEEVSRLVRALGKTTFFITHDLDEAMLLGDRVAIMKDGQFRQVGTPEEIVLRPADDHVAAFVRHAPRLNFLKASSLIDPSTLLPSALPIAWPRVEESTRMDELLQYAISSNAPIVVMAPDGTPKGLITRRSLLKGLQPGGGGDMRLCDEPALNETAAQ